MIGGYLSQGMYRTDFTNQAMSENLNMIFLNMAFLVESKLETTLA